MKRIRGKIAASKAKGMWMGGNVPLGYDARDRKLVVNGAEAETVRLILRRCTMLEVIVMSFEGGPVQSNDHAHCRANEFVPSRVSLDPMAQSNSAPHDREPIPEAERPGLTHYPHFARQDYALPLPPRDIFIRYLRSRDQLLPARGAAEAASRFPRMRMADCSAELTSGQIRRAYGLPVR